MANACGPCIGQWKRDDVKPGEKNSILNSFNRNFPGRNDGNAETLSFIASPEIVMALGLAGRLSFNPLTDALPGGARLRPPAPADEVPKKGFVAPMEGYVAPAEDGSKVEVIVDPRSPRLQLLQPFFGLALAGLLLGEPVAWTMIAVTALVVLCVAGAKRFA